VASVDDSLEKTAEEAIRTYFEGLGLVPAPTTIQTDQPARPAKRTLPTLEVNWGVESWRRAQREQVGAIGDRGIWSMGELEYNVDIAWRAGSRDDAEAFRRHFRNRFLLSTVDQETEATSVDLPARFFDEVDDGITLYLQNEGHFVDAKPRDTATTDYWVLAYPGLVTMPLLVLEDEPGTGEMDILIVGGQADIDPFPVEGAIP
jgi:hypothetical protein